MGDTPRPGYGPTGPTPEGKRLEERLNRLEGQVAMFGVLTLLGILSSYCLLANALARLR